MKRMTILVVAGLGACATPAETKPVTTQATAAVAPAIADASTALEESGEAEFERQLQRTKASYERVGLSVSPARSARLKERFLREFAENKLIAQKAKAEGVAVTPEEVAVKLSELGLGDEEALALFLEATEQTEGDVKAALERSMLRDKLFATLFVIVEPTDDDAKKYYDDHLEEYQQKESIKASHILFKVDQNSTESDKKARLAEAKKVLAEARQADADFGALAEMYSEDTHHDGGNLGTFARGTMVEPFETAAFATAPGDVIGPVKTRFGYHIIKVYEKTVERQRTFDEVKGAIFATLKARQRAKATRELLDTLSSTAEN